jgi:hypothetical protein
VYVAEYSHASYFRPGLYDTEAIGFHEWADGEGEERSPKLIDITRAPQWTGWPGRWGEDGSSPHGPRYGRTQWTDPQLFHERARACSIEVRDGTGESARLREETRCPTPVIRGREEFQTVYYLFATNISCVEAYTIAQTWIKERHERSSTSAPCAPADGEIEPRRCRISSYTCTTPHTEDGASVHTLCNGPQRKVRFATGV